MMDKNFARRLMALLPVVLVVSNMAFASSDELQKAVTVYYAGHPHEAVDMIRPLAAAGDVEAQYLLGNILYSLSKTQQFNDFEDPATWYQMAAEQGVADASYALGVIHNNNWDKSRDKQQAALAITHFQKAFDRGFNKAKRPLKKLMSRSGLTLKKAMKLAKAKKVGKVEPVVIAKPIVQPIVVPIEKKVEKVEVKVAVAMPVVEADTANQSEPEKDAGIAKSEETAALSTADSEEKVTIQLAEIVDQCSKYTDAGYDSYAETIRGALLKGKAKIKSMSPDPATPGTKVIHFEESKSEVRIALKLFAVPRAIANKYQPGSVFEVSGIVGGSKIEDATCIVNLTYSPG